MSLLALQYVALSVPFVLDFGFALPITWSMDPGSKFAISKIGVNRGLQALGVSCHP